MKRLLTALAICTAAVVMLSGDSQAAETQTAFFQPRPGGVVDVITGLLWQYELCEWGLLSHQ